MGPRAISPTLIAVLKDRKRLEIDNMKLCKFPRKLTYHMGISFKPIMSTKRKFWENNYYNFKMEYVE